MTFIALIVGILLGVGCLVWGYADAGFLDIAQWLTVFGLVWVYSQWRRWNWMSSVGLFGVVFMAAVGFWFEFNPGWMIAGAAFALFAWDMTEFRRRIQFLIMEEELRGMERRHIARVSLVIITGLFLVTLALYMQIGITFEWGVFLVVVILLGLSQLVAWFRRQSR